MARWRISGSTGAHAFTDIIVADEMQSYDDWLYFYRRGADGTNGQLEQEPFIRFNESFLFMVERLPDTPDPCSCGAGDFAAPEMHSTGCGRRHSPAEPPQATPETQGRVT